MDEVCNTDTLVMTWRLPVRLLCQQALRVGWEDASVQPKRLPIAGSRGCPATK